MDALRRLFLQQSSDELQTSLESLNALFARQLRELRDDIAMAHELLREQEALEEGQVRDLVKTMVEGHPRGEAARATLRRIEEVERRLAEIADRLGQ